MTTEDISTNDIETHCMLLTEMFLVLRPDLDKRHTLDMLIELFSDEFDFTVSKAVNTSYLIVAGSHSPGLKN